MLRTQEQRQVLLDLELTSTARAHACVPVVSCSPPSSAAPSGDDTPATYWRLRFADARSVDELRSLVAQARAEVRAIRRRPFAPLRYETADELAERIISDGEGVDALRVAIAMRCTPTFVRRARIARGRDPEHGRVVDLDALEPRALLDAGLSVRQAAAVLGLPRSTLHERARAAAV
jgi:hypothetical protein